jgi:hypothetical protein
VQTERWWWCINFDYSLASLAMTDLAGSGASIAIVIEHGVCSDAAERTASLGLYYAEGGVAGEASEVVREIESCFLRIME